MEEETKKDDDKPWLFKEGNPGGGRKPETPEQKIIKKATKELIAEYKEKLAEALPLIEPKMIEKAVAGDIQFIKELHDRVMGKPDQKTDITSDGKPLYLPPELLNKNDLTSPSTEPDSK